MRGGSVFRQRVAYWLGTVVMGLAVLASRGCRAAWKAPWERAPLGRGAVEATSLRSGPVFDLERVRFWSRELDEPRFVLVLKPHGGPPPRDAWILNHGWADRPEILLEELGIEARYSRFLEEHPGSRPLIVIPDVRFPNFFRVHSSRFPFGHYLVLLAEEVVRLVTDRYSVPAGRSHWSIGGFSFGGYASLDVGRRYPGLFGRVSVISGFSDPDWSFWPAEPPAPGTLDERGRGKQTVVVPGPAPRLMLACGDNDRFYGQMVDLHEQFARLGIAHDWSHAPGGHTWAYWRSVIDAMCAFHLGGGDSRDPQGLGTDGRVEGR
jgi:hypothetical protein